MNNAYQPITAQQLSALIFFSLFIIIYSHWLDFDYLTWGAKSHLRNISTYINIHTYEYHSDIYPKATTATDN